METTYRQLTNEERDAIMYDLDMAYSICKKYIPEFDGTFSSAILSRVFALWLTDTAAFVEKDYDTGFNSRSEKKPTATMIKYALGSAFGDVLNNKYKSDWIHVTDQYGKEISVHHTDPGYTVFPYSSVEKRIKSKETDFFLPIEEFMRSNIEKK